MADTGQDEKNCLERVQQGDEIAARELVQRLYPLVYKLVCAHRPRRTDEEDLCQMIYMKIFSNLQQYSGQVPLEHWVSRIAVNTCINQLKAEKVRPELRWADLSEEQETVIHALLTSEKELDPAQSIASRELVDMLLDRLDPKERLVISLLHIEGRSVEEIKQLTGWSMPLVKVRAFRARQKVKALFQQLTKETKL